MVKILLATLIVTVLYSCKNTGSMEEPVSSEGNNTVSISIIKQLAQCAPREPGVEIIESSVDLEKWWKLASRASLPQPALPTTLREVQFDHQQLIVVNLGTKPSLGYSVELLEKHAVVEKNNLIVALQENGPSADMLTAQVVTTPCAVLLTEKTGFSEVILKGLEANNQ